MGKVIQTGCKLLLSLRLCTLAPGIIVMCCDITLKKNYKLVGIRNL